MALSQIQPPKSCGGPKKPRRRRREIQVNWLESILSGMQRKFFHGTNLIAACHILRSGHIRADIPVDSEDGSRVVCVTLKRKVARAFAVEFPRHNSRLPVGAVFTICSGVSRILPWTPVKSETASFDEHELRISGNIPLQEYSLGVAIVGAAAKLDDDRWMLSLYEDEDTGFTTFSEFSEAVQTLRETTLLVR